MSGRDNWSCNPRGGCSDPAGWDEGLGPQSDETGEEGRVDYEPGSQTRRMAIKVLYHDADLIVVDKPPGLCVEYDLEDLPSVVGQLTAKRIITDEESSWHAVYPLDAEASGVLVLARSPDAAETLRGQMGGGVFELCMSAIVRGSVSAEYGTIKHPIREPSAGRVARVDVHRGKPAVTDWRLRDRFVGFALLDCLPRTAVASQVRIHLATAGLPLAVDSAHDGADGLMLSSFKAGYHPSHKHPERPLIARLTLHAANVGFPHPRTGMPLGFESPWPKDFRAALQQLQKYGRLPPRS